MRPEIIKIPKVQDPRGNLAVIEKDVIPFDFKRVYYLFDVPSGAVRGGHAHKMQHEFLIPVSGSFTVSLNDTEEKMDFRLNKPDQGLLIPRGYWRELNDFSSGGVCLVLASAVFDEEDYIRKYADFLKFKKS